MNTLSLSDFTKNVVLQNINTEFGKIAVFNCCLHLLAICINGLLILFSIMIQENAAGLVPLAAIFYSGYKIQKEFEINQKIENNFKMKLD